MTLGPWPRRPVHACRVAGLGLTLALLAGGCAQRPVPPTRPAPQDVGVQLLRELLNDPARIAETTGVPPGHPRFAAVQAGLRRLGEDPVLAPWLQRQLRGGARGPLLAGVIQQRSAAGLLRLPDAEVARHLEMTAGWLARIGDTDCARELGEIGRGGPATLRRQAELMTEDELRLHFETLLKSLRADLTRQPERPGLEAARRTQIGRRLASQLREQQEDPGRRQDACAVTAELLALPLRWEGRDRTDGMSFVLQLMLRPDRVPRTQA